MLPSYSKRKSASDGRVTLDKDLLQQWMDPDVGFYLVPLNWKRRISLPNGHELEAWYAWRGPSDLDDWIIDPKQLSLTSTAAPDFYLRQLIFDAKIDTDTRSSRLSCPGLLKGLGERSDSYVWLSAEPGSIAVWTDFAFQTWFGRLGWE
jgi:hypothetical protein